jgi:beta-lactamase class A
MVKGKNISRLNPAKTTRRNVLCAMGGAALLANFSGCSAALVASRSAQVELAKLERTSGARLGVFALDTATGQTFGLNQDERFSMCSTFKLLLAAVVLREADAGRLKLETFLPYSQQDMVSNASVTEKYLDKGGMSIVALAEAAQKTSDNVAANLLIKHLGGTEEFTKILRGMNDSLTRIDRLEPQLNLGAIGEVRDTTTPRAMSETVARLVAGNLLMPASREMLIKWLIETSTGLKRIRAGIPAGWQAGDKTGTAAAKGMPNKHNDVAVIWPPGRAPIIVTVFLNTDEQYKSMRPEDDAVHAQVGRITANWVTAV